MDEEKIKQKVEELEKQAESTKEDKSDEKHEEKPKKTEQPKPPEPPDNTAMDNAEVPKEGRILFITSDLDGRVADLPMTIIDRLIPARKYNRPFTKSEPKRICVHYTGDVGASAAISFQYIVGIEGEVIRCVPDNEIAYGASGKNAGTIHIEVCYKRTSGEFEEKSIDALNELVYYLMQRYGIVRRTSCDIMT